MVNAIKKKAQHLSQNKYTNNGLLFNSIVNKLHRNSNILIMILKESFNKIFKNSK